MGWSWDGLGVVLGLLLGWSWDGLGLPLGWSWDGLGVVLGWSWAGCEEVVLGWSWAGLGLSWVTFPPLSFVSGMQTLVQFLYQFMLGLIDFI